MSAVKAARALQTSASEPATSSAPATPTKDEAATKDLGRPPKYGTPKAAPLDALNGPGSCKVLERQLAENVASGGESTVVVAKTLIALAKARRAQGKIDAAIAHLERSLGILESLVLDPTDAGVVLATLSELAGCCAQLGRLDDATALLKRALEVAQGTNSRKAAEIRAELKNIDKTRRAMAGRRSKHATRSRSSAALRSPPSNALVRSPSRRGVNTSNPTARTLYAN